MATKDPERENGVGQRLYLKGKWLIFSELMKDTSPQMPASQGLQCRINKKKSIPGDIGVKPHNPKEECVFKTGFCCNRIYSND